MKKEDYKFIVWDIEDYITQNEKDITSGEGQRILEDIREIIKSYEEEK